jgi:hypothetical protein
MRFRNLLFCLLLLTAVGIAAAAQVKLEIAGPLKDSGASPEIVKALAPEGHRVVLGNGNALCEVWLVTLPPAPPQDKDTEHTNYSGVFATGALVGVISFPEGAKDFRGQAIKPGAYPLRYAVMPNDGAHMGAAPQRDFLLLSPLASDTRTAVKPQAELIKASSAAAGTNHPAAFLLLPAPEVGKTPTPSTGSSPPKPPGNKDGATAYQSPEGYVVLAGEAGGVPLALVVKGQAEQ